MDHPMIREMETWGYPKEYEHRHVFTDDFGNEVYKGDEYFEMDDHRYLIEAISDDAFIILERHGADRRMA